MSIDFISMLYLVMSVMCLLSDWFHSNGVQLRTRCHTRKNLTMIMVMVTIGLSVIASMTDVGIPNGIDVDEYGNIFISDSGKGDVFKIVLDEPMQVGSITVWDENTAFFVNRLGLYDPGFGL